MDRTASREEIECRIKKIDNEIEELRQADDGVVDFIKISQLEDEKEKLENELEEIVTEMTQNSGVDLEQAQENEVDERLESIELQRLEKEKIEGELRDDAKREKHQEQKENEEKDDSEELLTNGKDEPKPLDYWEYRSGIVLLPCDGSRNALEVNAMTRDEFMNKLSESVTIIKELGKAEEFLKNRPEDWEKVRNSKEEFQKVIANYGNDLPVEIDTEQVYVLYQNDEDIMHEAEKEVVDENVEVEYEKPRQSDIEMIKKYIPSEVVQKYAVITAKEALDLAEKGILDKKEMEEIAKNIEEVHQEQEDENAAMTNEGQDEVNNEGKVTETIEEVIEQTVKEVNEEREEEGIQQIESDIQEQQEIVEVTSVGKEMIKNMLTNSIDSDEMIDDTMSQKSIKSVTVQIEHGIANGIEENIEQEMEEEHLPGFSRKPY